MPAASATVVGLASLDRARVYRALARLFAVPDEAGLAALRGSDLPDLRRALPRLGADGALEQAADAVGSQLAGSSLEHLESAFHDTFDASGGLPCPPNETSHTAATPELSATRTYQLADLAGFYRAFGVEVAPGTERPDHITAELEFMHLLAVKEAAASEEESERVEICREASRAFMRDHLGRWATPFAHSLEAEATHPLYVAAGRLLDGFVALDSAWLGAR